MVELKKSSCPELSNKEVFEAGTMRLAEKAAVLMVDLGPLSDLPRSGVASVAFVDDGIMYVRTQEQPEGAFYRSADHLIVRPTVPVKAPLVFIDAYAVPESKLADVRGLPIDDDLGSVLSEAEMGRVAPVLYDVEAAELEYDVFWSKPDERTVIMVDHDLLCNDLLRRLSLSDGEHLLVHNEWGGDCWANEGDAIVVTDAERGFGYRVAGDSFRGTYQLINS